MISCHFCIVLKDKNIKARKFFCRINEDNSVHLLPSCNRCVKYVYEPETLLEIDEKQYLNYQLLK